MVTRAMDLELLAGRPSAGIPIVPHSWEWALPTYSTPRWNAYFLKGDAYICFKAKQPMKCYVVLSCFSDLLLEI